MVYSFAALFFLFLSIVSAQNISTIAGGGPRNLPALQTGLPQPFGVATYGGSVYVSLLQTNQIWKIDSNRLVTVFAGNGATAFSGDGQLAINATLNHPRGLAFDFLGNLYVADTGNHRVRRITPAGIISTFSGNGTTSTSGDSGLATTAGLNYPVAVSVDEALNVFIVDSYENRVRRVSPTGTITTFAGNGVLAYAGNGGAATSASLYYPTGVAGSLAGTVYISEGNIPSGYIDPTHFPATMPPSMPRLRAVTGGTISNYAGTGILGYSGNGGPALLANLSVTNVYTTPSLYILEPTSFRSFAPGTDGTPWILSQTNNGNILGSSGDGGPLIFATFRNITSMSVGSPTYLVDSDSNVIRSAQFPQFGALVTAFAGNGSPDFNGEGLPAINASILGPNGLAIDPAGSLIYTDGGSSSLRKVTLSTGLLSRVGGTGIRGLSSDGALGIRALYDPVAPVADPRGGYYFVEQDRIRKVTNGVLSTIANSANAHGFSGDGGPALAASFNGPFGLALAANGDLYVADLFNQRIRVINARTGIISTVAGNGDPSSTGDGGLATTATLNSPYAVALDGAGNLFVAEQFGNRVRKINLASNVIFTVAGDGTQDYADNKPAVATGLNFPSSIFADQSGNLFIADTRHSAVRKVAAGTGIITTVAGTGVDGFSGDGGAATAALTTPNAITIDRNQNLYIADASGRIRTTQVSACFFTIGTPSLNFGAASGSGIISITATIPTCTYSLSSDSPFFTITGPTSGTGSGTIAYTIAANSGAARTATLNVGGAAFNISQAPVVSQTNVGYLQTTNGPLWALDANGNGKFDIGDKFFSFSGQPGAIAVVGDWNGDGHAKVGYYLNGFWILDYNGNGVWDGPNGGDKFYAFGGDSSYVPVVGDWTGDGLTKIGYYHNGYWALDLNGNGSFDAQDGFYGFGGNPNEIPLVGDWNGDKRTKIGVYYNGIFALDYDGDGHFTAADKYYPSFGNLPGDKPIVGDWNANGTFKIGLFRSGFWALDYNGNGTWDGTGPGGDKFYAFGGQPGSVPLVGDWNGDGTSKVGTYNAGFWLLDFNGNGQFDGTGPGQDRFLAFGGTPGNQPILGKW